MTPILKRAISVWVVSVLGVIVTIVLSARIYLYEFNHCVREFKKEAHEQSKILKEFIEESFKSVDAIDAFFISSGVVTREEFQTFTRHFLESYPYVQSVEWVPRVKQENRDQFEQMLLKEGLDGFHLKQQDSQGRLVKAAIREEYFPIIYIEPIQESGQMIGFDLGSEYHRRELLKLAGSFEGVFLSPVIKLVQDRSNLKDGLLVVKHILKSNEFIDKSEMSDSYVLLVMRLSSLIEEALEHEKSHQMQMYVFDVSEEGQRELIYKYGAVDMNQTINLPKIEAREIIDIGQRRWELVMIPQNHLIGLHQWGAITVALCGLGLTALLGIFMFMQRRKEEIIEGKIEERTEELSHANEKLRTEIALRIRAEEITRNKIIISEAINRAVNEAMEMTSVDMILKHSLKAICRVKSSPLGFVYSVCMQGKNMELSSLLYECSEPKNYQGLIDIASDVDSINREAAFVQVLNARKLQKLDLMVQEDKNIWKDVCESCHVHCVLLIPIVVFDAVVGVFAIFHTDLNLEDVEMINGFVTQIGRVLERKETERKLREEKERLQLFQNVTVTREMEIIELKKENNELHRRLGFAPPYDMSFLEKSIEGLKKMEVDHESHGPSI